MEIERDNRFIMTPDELMMIHENKREKKTLRELVEKMGTTEVIQYLKKEDETPLQEDIIPMEYPEVNTEYEEWNPLADIPPTSVTTKEIPLFEKILLFILGKDEYQVNNRISINTTKGTYMGDYGTIRTLTIKSLDSVDEFIIRVFTNVFMQEINETTMMQIMDKHPLASRYAYHNNRLMEVTHIKGGFMQFNIDHFESEELKNANFDTTLIGLVNLVFGDTTYGSSALLE